MLLDLPARLRSVWRAVRKRPAFEREMDEEFSSHVALRADDLVRQGLPRDAAIRQARHEFGLPEEHKHRARASRGLTGVDRAFVSWLDFKLGFRMLIRYPALTIVAGIALAFGIASGLATFSFVGQVLYPTLPLPQGDEVVGIRMWNVATSRTESIAPADVEQWRQELPALADVGAFRTMRQNLRDDAQPFGQPLSVAAISASGFRLTRTPPLLGRTLQSADELPGAPPVVVISHDTWRSQLNADSTVIGRQVRVGAERFTVVGVMPDGFAFPIAHEAWIPLVHDASRLTTPSLTRVFARLQAGHSIEEVQARLDAITVRERGEKPDSLARLRPELLPYTRSIFDLSALEARVMLTLNVVAVMFLLVVCGNVAMLMFARAAARESELVVRRALGATTSRIVMQLVSEAMVLGGVAAIVGILAARFAVGRIFAMIEVAEGMRPFWVTDATTAGAYWYAGGLTLLVAMVTGGLPAFKVLRGMSQRLRESSSGGGGVHFGGVWTAVVVAQVAITLAFPASTFFVLRDAAQIRALDPGFPEREYLAVQFDAERDASGDDSSAAFHARLGRSLAEIKRRLESEPGVVRAAYTDALPHTWHPGAHVIVDDGGAARADSTQGHWISTARVDTDWFTLLGAQVQGRALATSDAAPDDKLGGSVVVNESFVRFVLGGRNAIGRRVRYVPMERGEPVDTLTPWHTIVGVVKDLAMHQGGDPSTTGAGIYHVAEPGTVAPVHLVLHVRGVAPTSLVDRVRVVAADVDAALHIERMTPLDDVNAAEFQNIMLWFWLLVVASALTMLLSLAGIYSVMSFTVSRRTREIGIRVALGSDPRRVTLAVLARPLRQVAIGVLVGGLLVGLLVFSILGALTWLEYALVIGYALLMLLVCLLAGLVPVRRALRIQPTEALRVDV